MSHSFDCVLRTKGIDKFAVLAHPGQNPPLFQAKILTKSLKPTPYQARKL